MTNKELDEVIAKIEHSNSSNDAYFSIEQYGGGIDECSAKANKPGLELYALQFLKASRGFEEIINDETKNIYPLDDLNNWMEDGEIFIDYIEFTNNNKEVITKENYKETFFEKLIPAFFIAIAILIISLIIIGIITTFKWIF